MSTLAYLDQLFDSTVDVYINSKIRLALTDTSQIQVKQTVNPDPCVFGIDGITLTIEDPNREYIINRIYGLPMDTGDAEEDLISASHIYAQSMPIEKIIEIWDMTGEVRFVDEQGLIRAHEIADGYLNEVNQRARYSPNFRGIPEEDKAKIKSFVLGTTYLAELLNGGTVMAQGLMGLMAGHTMSVLFDNAAGDDVGLLIQRGSQKTNRSSQRHTETYSPYGFNHR